jgi:hypothetical protein
MLVRLSLSSSLTIYLTTVQKSIFSAALTAVALLSAGFKEPETAALLTQRQLNEQSVLALNWVQQSGEYAALTHQAFNTARTIFDYTRFSLSLSFCKSFNSSAFLNNAYLLWVIAASIFSVSVF